MIRKATMEDLEKIEQLYSDVLDYEEIHHYANWKRGVYPTTEVALNGIKGGTMYIGEQDGKCFGSGIFNQTQAPEYKTMDWTFKAPDKEIFAVHTLCISPFFTKQGKGKEFLKFAEELGKSLGCKYIRLDTHENNLPAFSLYKKYGFNYVGKREFVMAKGDTETLRCLDKKL